MATGVVHSQEIARLIGVRSANDLSVHNRRDIGDALRGLIEAQSGMLRADQALKLGLGYPGIRRLVDQGHWIRLENGLFDSAPLLGGFEKRAWTAYLAAGEGAALGGEAALRLHGLERQVNQIEMWVPPDRQPDSLPGIRMRRDGVGRLSGRAGLLSRIRAVDALVDVGQRLPTEQLVGLLTDALRQRVATLRVLGQTLEARSRVRDRKRFELILGDLAGIESPLEYAYRRDVERAHGLPDPSRQASVTRGTRSDVYYDEFALIIELDGRVGHVDGSSSFRDLKRDNVHAGLKLTTFRYGSADVRGKPCEVAAQVAHALLDRGWAGPYTGCPRCRVSVSGTSWD
jgi:hypothetical protein